MNYYKRAIEILLASSPTAREALLFKIAAESPGALVRAADEPPGLFSVVLLSRGADLIDVIREVRNITNLGLKEAKDLVEAVPKSVKEGLKKEEAEQIKKRLETAGATVEIRRR